MPSKLRKPQKNSKLATHQTTDGWTHVGRRNHTLPASSITTPSLPALRALLERLTPAQATLYIALSSTADEAHKISELQLLRSPREARSGESLAELRARYERIARSWRGCEARARLAGVLRERGLLEGVRKTVCLGLGSPSGETGAGSALWQLAAFVDMRGMVEGTGTVTVETPLLWWCVRRVVAVVVVIRVNADSIHPSPIDKQSNPTSTRPASFAQDPIFNTLDTSLLTSLNISTLDNPTAFAQIDDSTLVFAPHYPIAAWSAEMRRGVPRLLIGNHVSEGLDQ